MQHDSLTYNTLKNASYGFLGYAWPILFSIFVTPLVVHKLGVSDYGIYIITITINGFLGLLDLGLSTALVKFFAEYHAIGDNHKFQKLINDANTYFLFIGVIGFVVFALVGKYFLPTLFHVTNSQHIGIVFYLAGVVFFINAVNSVFTIMPQALQRYDVATKLSMLQLTIFNLGFLCLLMLGFQLKAVFIMNIAIALFITVLYRWHSRRMVPHLHYRFGKGGSEITLAFKFGLLAALNNLSTGALNLLDRLIVPIFTNPATLSYYSLPGNVAQKTAGVVGSISSILYPMSTALAAKGEMEKLKQIYRRSIRIVTVVAAAITVGIAAFSYPILKFWIGVEFAQRGFKILVILAITYFILSLYQPLSNFLMGFGKVKLLAQVSLSLAVLNVVLLILLVPPFGILGAAYAFLGAVAPIPFIFYFVEKYLIHLNHITEFYLRLYVKICIVASLLYVIAKYILVPIADGLWPLLLLGPFTVIMFFLIYRIFGFFEPDDWQIFMDFSRRIIVRINPKR